MPVPVSEGDKELVNDEVANAATEIKYNVKLQTNKWRNVDIGEAQHYFIGCRL